MRKRVRIIRPRWARWVPVAAMLIIWGVLTYGLLKPEPSIAFGEWGMISLMLALGGGVGYLVGSGRLGRRSIEIEIDDTQQQED